MRSLTGRILASTITSVVMLGLAASASAVTINVNSVDDPGTGTCDVTECTLREAITQANADAVADVLDFSGVTTGSGPIFLASALPAVTQPLTVDGTTHPDFSDGFPGVIIDGSGLAGDGLHVTGGTTTIRGVEIDSFAGDGIQIDTAGNNVLKGNSIGTGGTITGAGVSIASSTNVVGGTGAGEANEIQADGDGVSVLSGTGNQIRGNTFASVGGLAIDLANDGRTPNDAGDGDTGANNRQNFPVLTSVTISAPNVTFVGTLGSAANTQYTIDFYAASGCGGLPLQHLGSTSVMTNGSGDAAINSTFMATPLQDFGVATATDPAGNTSEVSDAVKAAGGAVVAGISPTCSALPIAQAMAFDPSTVTGASFTSIPPQNSPNAVGTGAFGAFPTHGASYGVLTSGAATHLAPSQSAGGGLAGPNVRGDTDFDVTVMKVDLNVPGGANCLTFDFRFLSDEYPDYLNSQYNDAFIAELDSTTWSTSGSVISAANNFAFDPSHEVISINSTGNTAMSHAATAGTGYDGGDSVQGGATPLLHASKVVTSGAHSLYLSIFDQGDHILDSAVEVDNLRFSTRDAAACVEGATSDTTPPTVTLVTPADGATISDTTPTYSGAAGTATGDLDTITVKIYAGSTVSGSPIQTITTTKSGGSWTVDGSTPLADGTYTAQAEQSDAAGNTGFSTANTFTITTLPLITIDNVTVTEGDAGTVNANFTVSLSEASADTVTAHFATADGSAVQPADYASNSGTVTFTPADQSEQVTVQVKGDTLDEINETFAVNLTSPANAVISDGSGTGTITDDDDPPAVSIGNQTVTEGNSGTVNAVFTVSLSAASGKTVTVQATTADGSATQPSDYASTTGTVTFTAGQTSQSFSVAVNGDTAVEPDETFTVTLSAPANVTLATATGTGTGTIVNDDSVSPPPPPVVPTISVGNVTVDPEGDSGTKPATFTVSLSSATTVTVSVKYATADVTASAPADYTAASGTLTFDPGQTSKTVTVNVAGDTVDESNETFSLRLSDPVAGTLGTAQGTGTIVDDDDAPVITPPGSVPADGVFCGKQHRGRCRGLQFLAQFSDAPGNATWTFDAFNPKPGGGKAAAAIRYTRLGTLKKSIKSEKPVKVTFKQTGRKADKALAKIRKRKLKRLRITTTFTGQSGKTYRTVKVIRLR